ncbi:glyceraldehyde-3-phosphate dehydrogenase, type I [Oleidesulfovibrio alaskensis G20]|jgi:glyceraldehyde 3-phosphate dehydrogenase|uniref:Glyceraldehyde-3-phosphate dehydrogenase n=1 Tax=Oleidesulfovibrio alaskensis (strain ATCC BAA-1058 / DSM 17464 / G20) TaxID=207559 RepID=Q30UW7_OLEA2|nr:type I glyceraldehyde-3-phosphate dehydrogenase [Oleidesulfovibrio alaskensis]ABB40529.1 glyceraldehyde-3-phosphate dehydrogenase, type I [Oleidesulfovibrio alaskensis G20]MBG0774567.1 type I glyceraldehyde-3-phosphate dehydrogenase [Oleidesulfovibrio alaskensis]MBL3580989.1 type I glyceraldehyde-3-phosphate dehydrogenase [Oleidesulfovibrio alaskensis]MBL3588023.1 type I glyceraldehyde-3-phosphate dehydrogenase [bacterium]
MKKVRVGINGFGRIGRQVLKTIWERHRDTVDVVAVNDLFDINTNAHLLSHDTNYRGFAPEVSVDGDIMRVGGDFVIKNYAERDPRAIPWGAMDVDIVIESTGIFTSGPKAAMHLEAGAKKVVISAPAKEEDITVVLGVNHQDYDPAKHRIISNASCTTNCLAPVVKVMHENFGIQKGVMTTVHSYTNDQRILDQPHRDMRRARAAACNMIPTSTGAAKAVALVIPEMKGRFEGYSVRVPTPTVSLVDFVAILERETTTEELRATLKNAAQGSLNGILGYSELPLVSSDFIGDPHSGIVEADFTLVQTGNLAKVYVWYDNEWGYSCRVADLVEYMRERGL